MSLGAAQQLRDLLFKGLASGWCEKQEGLQGGQLGAPSDATIALAMELLLAAGCLSLGHPREWVEVRAAGWEAVAAAIAATVATRTSQLLAVRVHCPRCVTEGWLGPPAPPMCFKP